MSETRILGVGMTRFARQPDRTPEDLAQEAILAALDDAGLRPQDVEAAFVGSAYLGDGTGQRILKDLGIVGVPIVNVANACASGGNAMHEADMWIRAQACEVALAVGVESLSRSLSGGMIPLAEDDLFGGLGLPLPGVYALIGRRYMAEYGATPEDFAMVTVKSRQHAMHNPYAMFQGRLTTIEEVLGSRMISDPITKLMCCANADGAAAVVLGSARAARRAGGTPVIIAGAAMGSGTLRDRIEQWEDEAAARVARQAYEAAGIGPEDVDVAEIQDPFTVAAVVYAEALGLAPHGEGARAFADGRFDVGTSGPAINTGGGLLSRGHPLGATGLAQVHDLVRQLRGQARGNQVEDAKVAVQFNAGGTVFELQSNACLVQVLVR